jgi:predicted enzyme related to lactoylglutathione lyase
VGDTDTAVARVESLGGSVITPAEDTPYGRIATVADPMGATFRLRTPPVA